MNMRNIIVFVLLFCSSLILSAQNKSSQFEQDLELINMRFFPSDQYDLSDNMRMIYVTDDYKNPLRRLGTVHSILKNHDGQCRIFVCLVGAGEIRYGGLVKANKELFGDISSSTYSRVRHDLNYGRPNSSPSEQDIEDLKIMMTFYPQDTARSFFNADYMMTYPYNMKGKACQGVYSRTRVVVIERNGLDVFFYFTMTDVGIKDFDKYLMDLKGVFGFNAMTRQDGH